VRVSIRTPSGWRRINPGEVLRDTDMYVGVVSLEWKTVDASLVGIKLHATATQYIRRIRKAQKGARKK
jgi:hypothetical protein